MTSFRRRTFVPHRLFFYERVYRKNMLFDEDYIGLWCVIGRVCFAQFFFQALVCYRGMILFLVARSPHGVVFSFRRTE